MPFSLFARPLLDTRSLTSSLCDIPFLPLSSRPLSHRAVVVGCAMLVTATCASAETRRAWRLHMPSTGHSIASYESFDACMQAAATRSPGTYACKPDTTATSEPTTDPAAVTEVPAPPLTQPVVTSPNTADLRTLVRFVKASWKIGDLARREAADIHASGPPVPVIDRHLPPRPATPERTPPEAGSRAGADIGKGRVPGIARLGGIDGGRTERVTLWGRGRFFCQPCRTCRCPADQL